MNVKVPSSLQTVGWRSVDGLSCLRCGVFVSVSVRKIHVYESSFDVFFFYLLCAMMSLAFDVFIFRFFLSFFVSLLFGGVYKD